ncbi:AAA family ATPase [Faecalimonas umbilicata]|uniref:AAA family ATPase n=1 Tax=Faecalimonas umbilicata TaxID=1912855 RepID=UPI00399115A8
MKLKNIKISNYRCFKEAEIDFDDHITLVVGKMELVRQRYWMQWLSRLVHFY